MVNKPKFEDQLSVIQVRKHYAAPYLKHRYLYLNRADVRTERKFKEVLNQKIINWPDGIYFLKLSNGRVFTRFKVHEGQIEQVFKVSPATGTRYPLHEFFIRR